MIITIFPLLRIRLRSLSREAYYCFYLLGLAKSTKGTRIDIF